MEEDNYFSLILCSVGNIKDIEIFLEELSKQIYKKFEVILVDQNSDDRLEKIVKKFNDLYRIVHIKSERGLSKARNKGIKYMRGNIVAFPDDDCIYPSDLLLKVNEFFKKNNYQGLVIRAVNSVPTGRIMHKNDFDQELNRKNVLKLVHSISLFLKKEIVDEVGNFDENLGLGSKSLFQGQEDRDYPLRALKLNYKIFFKRDIIVYHPWDDEVLDKQKNQSERYYKGAAAEMYLLKKHNFSFGFRIGRIFRRILVIIYLFILKRNNYKTNLSINSLKAMIKYFNPNLLPGENE